jgi:hypothetical protein
MQFHEIILIKEKIMYKKLVLVSAIAAVTTASHAGTFATAGFTQPVHSVEGAKNVADADGIGAGSVLVSLGAEYAANDTITFTFNNPKATNANWPTSLESVKPGTGGQNTAASVVVGDATVNFAATTNFVDGDIITIGADTTLYRITDVTTASAVKITPTIVTAQATAKAIASRNVKTLSLGLQNSTDTSATYRVLSIGGANTPTTTVGALIPTPMINIKTSDAVARATTVSVASATSTGAAMDATAGSASIMSTVTQYGLAVSAGFDQTVDVEQNSKAFVGSNTTNGTDTVTITLTAGTTVAGDTPTVSAAGALDIDTNTTAVVGSAESAVHTITGDFAFMDDAAAAGVTTSSLSSSASNTLAMATTGASFTITDANPIASDTITLTKSQTAAVIPTQTFAGSAVVSYTSNSTAGTTAITYSGVGTWGLNGASITVYGVPMGTTVDRMIWINNKGASSAAVTGSVIAGGVTTSDLALGTLAAKTAMSIDEALDTALASAGVTLPANSRATLTLSAPVKAADVTVSASYKVIADNDRLSLETSDTIQDTVSVTGTILAPSDCADNSVAQAAGTQANGQVAAGVLTGALAVTNYTATNAAAGAGTLSSAANAVTLGAITAGAINIDDIDCSVGGGSVTTATVAK